MNKMIITATLAVFIAGCASQSQQPEAREPSSSKESGHFSCGNALAKKWGTYWCVSASFLDEHNLKEMIFGTCEGSNSAEEEEPVDIVEIAALKHDPRLAASSKEWKDASAFDVTTKEHGKATLLIRPQVFKGVARSDSIQARIKVKVGGQDKDIRLTCGSMAD
jgi:hypothetical protein